MKIIANINSIIIRSVPTLISPGSVLRNVPNMILKFLALLTNLNTLNILNVLKTEVAVPTLLRMLLYSNITPTIVSKTTQKSNIFQVFLK